MLSMDVEAGRSDNARFAYNRIVNGYWIKKIDAPGEVFGMDVFDDSSIITISNATNWTGGADTGPLLDREGAPDQCVHCVTRRAVVELQLTQPAFDYFCAFSDETHSPSGALSGRLSTKSVPPACCCADYPFDTQVRTAAADGVRKMDRWLGLTVTPTDMLNPPPRCVADPQG
jgi:hypothetical protein